MAYAKGGSYGEQPGYYGEPHSAQPYAAPAFSQDYMQQPPRSYGYDGRQRERLEKGPYSHVAQGQEPRYQNDSNRYGNGIDDGSRHIGSHNRYDQASSKHQNLYSGSNEPRPSGSAEYTYGNVQRTHDNMIPMKGMSTAGSQQPYAMSHTRSQNQLPTRPMPKRSFSDSKQQTFGQFPQAKNEQFARKDDNTNPNLGPQGRRMQNPPMQSSVRARIIQEPQSPEMMSWDNPFPTFPNMQPGKKNSGKAGSGTQRPRTSSGGHSHGLAHSKGPHQATNGSRRNNSSNNNNGAQKSGTRDAETQGASTSLHLQYEAGLPSTEHQSQQQYSSREPYSENFNAPEDDRRAYETYQARSPNTEVSSRIRNLDDKDPPSSGAKMSDIKSQTLGSRSDSVPVVSQERAAANGNVADKRQYPSTQFTPATIQGRSNSFEARFATQMPALRDTHKPPSPNMQESYGEVFNSYYENPQANSDSFAPSLDEDMPNFDAIPTERPEQGHERTIDGQLHMGTYRGPGNNARDMTSRGRASDRGMTPKHMGQAHRSRSQPNVKVSQPNESFAQLPPMPSFNQQQSYLYDRHGGEQLSDSPHVIDRTYETSNHFKNGGLPSEASRSRPRHSPSHGAPDYRSTERPGTDTAGLHNAFPRQGANALTGHWPAVHSNPDALPEHPAPIRPGLAQQTPSNQAPKPPPMRQYNFNPPPRSNTVPVQDHVVASSEIKDTGPITHQELQSLRQTAHTNPNDQKTQMLLARKLVEAASILADEGGHADTKTRNKNRERYITDAHKIVKKLVSGGNTEAMFYLADCHGRGLLGLQIDPKEAFNLYQSAAKLGHAPSAYRVAVCCEMGQDEGGGTRRDPLKAIQWYKRAATLGDTPAMYKMGMIQLKGLLGQSRNPREAIVWLKRAAERADEENPHALHELGLLYENASRNDSVIRDEEYAKQLFLQAADLNYKFSQFRLGAAFEYGSLGCPIDPRQSIAWYSRAASQEEHQSELALSGWYLTGTDGIIQQSDTEAYLWARKAAQAGLAKAEYAMGYFTEVGIGAPADLEAAKRWYWRAASQNFPKARERLEDLRKGGARMQKSRVSRSAMNRSEGDCRIM